mmetsp:Transcript_32486/g.100520  ORF Transcript_32486/g.100520 Transcript_32486/m.100520 type:complete len:200 (-) Transcript_32486:449-1048(-)
MGPGDFDLDRIAFAHFDQRSHSSVNFTVLAFPHVLRLNVPVVQPFIAWYEVFVGLAHSVAAHELRNHLVKERDRLAIDFHGEVKVIVLVAIKVVHLVRVLIHRSLVRHAKGARIFPDALHLVASLCADPTLRRRAIGIRRLASQIDAMTEIARVGCGQRESEEDAFHFHFDLSRLSESTAWRQFRTNNYRGRAVCRRAL